MRKAEIALVNCLIMLDDPSRLGGVFAANQYGDWLAKKFIKVFADFAAMAKFAKVKATDTQIVGFSFEGGTKPDWSRLTVPSLAADSPAKGRGPGGRDLGPNLDAAGMPVPYVPQSP